MKEPKTAFITLTNNGYLDYTLNCIGSLKKIGFKQNLVCYAIGKKAYDALLKKGVECELINDETNTGFQLFREGNWANVTYYKFEIIHQNLKSHDFVCFTDGDIVYESNDFIKYCIDNIGDKDLLIQNDEMNDEHDGNLCSGFMFIRSNENTLKAFNPTTVMPNIQVGWDDQVYINSIKADLNYQKLPLALFPNGKYYEDHHKTISPLLIHFNWCTGHTKAYLILKYKKWYTTRLFFKFLFVSYKIILKNFIKKYILRST